jgi:hypothetical protein
MTGLDYFGAWYFSEAQGRFTSPDVPLSFRVGLRDRQNLEYRREEFPNKLETDLPLSSGPGAVVTVRLETEGLPTVARRRRGRPSRRVLPR